MRSHSNDSRKTLLSLFTGAGGLDLGLESAGFDVKLCIEVDEDCKTTIKNNRPEWRITKQGDIHKLTPKEALNKSRLKPGDLTLLAGGPPCQPFSKSSFWVNGDVRRLSDPRAKTLEAYIDLVEEALPETILIENVKGLVFNGKDEGFRYLEDGLERINKRHKVNYHLQVLHINCASFGVPQIRERIFLIGHREGILLKHPTPTHYPKDSLDGQFPEGEVYRTAWDAIGDLDHDKWPKELTPRGKWAELLPTIPEGHNYLWHTSKGGGEPIFGWRTRFWSFLLKLAKSQPSWTIQAMPGPATGPFHWRNRLLSIRELSRIQTFPDNFEFAGDYRSQHRQVGNAVPPAIGEMLGLEIRYQLLGENPSRKQSFIPSSHSNCPSPEPIQPVPTKFLYLRGDHPNHPGTGLGPGALHRLKNQAEVEQ